MRANTASSAPFGPLRIIGFAADAACPLSPVLSPALSPKEPRMTAARAHFTRMQDSTQADWALIVPEAMKMARALPNG